MVLFNSQLSRACQTPGVNWFRRGLQRSLGHAEALVLVNLEHSQIYLRTTKRTLWRLNPAGPRTGQRSVRVT
jgi:hypothetical protein